MTTLAAEIPFIDVFSGINGFGVGMGRAGLRAIAHIEIDKNCQRVLRENEPHTPIMGDICDVTGSDFRGLARAAVMCGGFPCQDTSIAAPHRSGLAGRRSGHYFEFTRLVDEYQRLVDELDPRWVVIENPPGLLASHQGRDMATVVHCLEDLGYGWAYRVVDGRFFGSPQRRRRVIVVGHRGGDPRPAWQVLGDGAGRDEADRTSGVRGRTIGPRSAGDPAQGAVVWRKSARPRAALSAGGYETWVADGMANTLTGFDGGSPTRQTHLLAQNGGLRALTPTEWERLQGFPDGWTAMIPESARYRALGNAMHVGMAEWLGRRIRSVHDATPQIGDRA